jgi:hypothetical protein
MQQHIRDEVQTRIRELIENPSGIVELNREIQELKDRQRQRFFSGITDVNYVAENINIVERFSHE